MNMKPTGNSWLKTIFSAENLPFTILGVLCLISIASRVLLVLR